MSERKKKRCNCRATWDKLGRRVHRGMTIARPQEHIDAPEVGKVLSLGRESDETGRLVRVRWSDGGNRGLTEYVRSRTLILVWPGVEKCP